MIKERAIKLKLCEGQQDGSEEKILATKTDNLHSIPMTQVEEENRLLQAVIHVPWHAHKIKM